MGSSPSASTISALPSMTSRSARLTGTMVRGSNDALSARQRTRGLPQGLGAFYREPPTGSSRAGGHADSMHHPPAQHGDAHGAGPGAEDGLGQGFGGHSGPRVRRAAPEVNRDDVAPLAGREGPDLAIEPHGAGRAGERPLGE